MSAHRTTRRDLGRLAPSRSERLYALAMRLYPRDFRDRFGDDMRELFRDQWTAARRRAGWRGVARLWLSTVPGVVRGATAEHLTAPPAPRLSHPERSTPVFETLARDLRLAVRTLRKSPVFTAVAVGVLTLGTGAVTTIFSVANAVALRPLPGVADADALVEVHRTRADGTVDGAGWDWASYPYFRHLRDHVGAAERGTAEGGTAEGGTSDGDARAVTDVAAWAMMPLTVAAGADAVAAQGSIVSGNYFRVLGVRPALGRFFAPDEDGAPGAPPVVVVSHAFWTTRLGGDPAAVGRSVRLNGRAFTVVGVAPPKFRGVLAAQRNDAWVPLAAQPLLRPGADLADPRPTWLQLVARVRGAAGRNAAQRELSRATARWAAEGNEPADQRPYTAVRVEALTGLPSDLRGGVLGFLALLLGASGLVLLVASANVAAMLLARAVARRGETALRLALGASRGRLVRQLLTETLLLYAVGAAGGVLAAASAPRLLALLPQPADTPFALDLLDPSPDARVLAFALGVALATGVAFGLAPARQAARGDLAARLRTDAAGAGARRSAAQGALVAGQTAVSLVLLVAAGLFLRALDRGRRADLGFDPSHVAVAGLDVGTYGYGGPEARRFYGALKERVGRTPGVVAVAYARNLPLSVHQSDDLRIDGSAAAPAGGRGTPVRFGEVDAGYFDVVRTPVVAGRGFTAADDARAPRVAVVNQAFARRYWPEGAPASALGRTFRRGGRTVTVVGVARDAHYARLGEALRPFVYFALAQVATPADHAELLVRTSDGAGDPARLAPAVRAAVRALDPGLPAPAVTTLTAVTGAALLPQRAAALVTVVLGAVGLLLAAAGLYGVVAYVVGRRARELAVRVALGAGRRDVVRLVVGAAMGPVAAGLAGGLLLAFGATRLLTAYLLGVGPLDAVAFAGGASVLTAVALAASYLPARRAASADPVRALRAE